MVSICNLYELSLCLCSITKPAASQPPHLYLLPQQIKTVISLLLGITGRYVPQLSITAELLDLMLLPDAIFNTDSSKNRILL